MKKLGGLLVILGLVGIQVSVFFVQFVSAAACANTSSFGAVTLTVPELPDTKEQTLWVRMQAPEATNKIFAEINQNECLEIGGFKMPPNEWSWQTYRVGGTISPVSFISPTNNTIKIIGVDAGVKVDRILLAEKDCVPEDFGNNCHKVVELSDMENDQFEMLPPPSKEAVSGQVVLSQTPSRRVGELKEVRYIVNGKVVQSASSAAPFDTTLLENGKYTVQIETYLKNGMVVREATVVEIKNPENVLTPIVRWLKSNRDFVIKFATILGSLVLSFILVRLLIGWLKKRRERSFHGF